jgi:hypothetical protein
MRGVVVAVAVAAGVAVGAAQAAATTATVTVRGYPLLCGKPRGSLVVTFPAAVDLPRTIAAGSVHVNGQAAARVTIHARDVTVAVPPATGVTCQSITLGRVTLAFGTGAGIASAKAGTYAVTVRSGTHRYNATLTVGT